VDKLVINLLKLKLVGQDTTVKNSIFMGIMLCGPLKSTAILEEYVTSIFRVIE
jgi:hypothetical protein